MNKNKYITLALMLAITLGATNVLASTVDFTILSAVGCDVIKFLLGPVGKIVATVGIVFLGIGAFMGKLNWGTVLTVCLGMFLIFGAAYIVNQMSTASSGGGVAGGGVTPTAFNCS